MYDQARGHGAALVTIVIWGTTFISTKVLLEYFRPIEILALRFLLGFLALAVASPKRLRTAGWRQELTLAGAGLCGVTLYYLLENIALTHTLASNVGVIVSVSPFFTALFSGISGDRERLHGRFFLGFGVAMAGVCLLSFHGAEQLSLDPTGDLLALGAAVVWAGYGVLTKKISGFGYPILLTTRRTFGYGLLFMLPALPLMGFRPEWQAMLQPVNLGNLLFLGLGASALCFVTWNFSVRALGAVKTSAYIYLVPVITVVTSAIVLKEPVTPQVVLGTALALAGLMISQKREREIQRKE